uniref:NADH-ubiquinone oxidoreductase chain 4 n=1 Tax=Pedicinus obtusus TaxID=592408 RepID=A0A7L9CY54_9NEOP|nr:NADH dehydrogenase subunit 4 [Pedicinus obtusus]
MVEVVSLISFVIMSVLFPSCYALVFGLAFFTVMLVMFQPVEPLIQYWFMSDMVSWLIMLISIYVIMVASFPFWERPIHWVWVKILFMASIVFLYSTSMLSMFIAYEVSMIPIIYIVFFKSLSPERMKAGWYLFLYTALASVPLMVVIIFLATSGEKTFLYFLNSPQTQWVELFMLLAFLVKTPLFFFHSWLLKAHVEASLEGSVLLAGVLLKFGSYGVYRLKMSGLFLPHSFLSRTIAAVALFGSVLGAIGAFTEMDFKKIVAYSSVSHMNLSMGSLLFMKMISSKSFLLMTLSHAMSAVVLFFMATSIYSSVGGRSILLIKNFYRPDSWWLPATFMVWVINMSLPPSLGFMSEVMMLSSVSYSEPALAILMVTSFMISSSYSSMAAISSALLKGGSVLKKESESLYSFMVVFLCIAPCILLFFLAFFMLAA